MRANFDFCMDKRPVDCRLGCINRESTQAKVSENLERNFGGDYAALINLVEIALSTQAVK